MKYIRVIGSGCPTQYMADYNTRHYSEEELEELCHEWNEEDNTDRYEVVDCD